MTLGRLDVACAVASPFGSDEERGIVCFLQSLAWTVFDTPQQAGARKGDSSAGGLNCPKLHSQAFYPITPGNAIGYCSGQWSVEAHPLSVEGQADGGMELPRKRVQFASLGTDVYTSLSIDVKRSYTITLLLSLPFVLVAVKSQVVAGPGTDRRQGTGILLCLVHPHLCVWNQSCVSEKKK